jgi:PmbA protein
VQADSGFSYSRDFLRAWWTRRWPCQKLGATDAGAEASEGCGLSVSVRKGELETVERNRDKSLGVTVYLGQRRGNASTSDFSEAAIKQTVQAAYDIARFTAEDPAAGLPDAADIALPGTHRDLDLFHPWDVTSEEAAAWPWSARRPPWAPPRITNSEGAGVSAQQSHFFSAHTRAFAAAMPARATACRWRPSPRCPARTARCSATTGTAPCATRRSGLARGRGPLRRRARAEPPGQPQDPTTECPVLFESPLAAGLLGGFVQAVSGGALYRKSSFLLDSLGKPVFPKHIDIEEDPFILRGKGSSPLTTRACACRRARWWMPAACRAISCPATRRASWA